MGNNTETWKLTAWKKVYLLALFQAQLVGKSRKKEHHGHLQIKKIVSRNAVSNCS